MSLCTPIVVPPLRHFAPGCQKPHHPKLTRVKSRCMSGASAAGYLQKMCQILPLLIDGTPVLMYTNNTLNY
jgi:hypothetical protein